MEMEMEVEVLGCDKEEDSFDVKAMQKLLLNYEKAREEGFAPTNPQLECLLAAMRREGTAEENIRFPGKESSHIKTRSQEIALEPFFVVKTSDEKKQKVFINICGSSKIAAPGEWEDGVPAELEEAFTSVTSEQKDGALNLRFPLSCSDAVISTDKRGNPCHVYDVVYNSSITRQSMAHKGLRIFLIDMAITWISQKNNTQLKPD
eukprot:c14307_g1_i1 orf=1-615(+)